MAGLNTFDLCLGLSDFGVLVGVVCKVYVMRFYGFACCLRVVFV